MNKNKTTTTQELYDRLCMILDEGIEVDEAIYSEAIWIRYQQRITIYSTQMPELVQEFRVAVSDNGVLITEK